MDQEDGLRRVPAVTVVVPMRDNSKTIEAQLHALSRQQYEGAWEVIVADNGSTDTSLDVVARFTNRIKHFRLVDASDVPGVSHARNVGVREGRGEAILFTDADDVVCPGWITALVDALEDSDLAGGPLDEVTINPEYAREWGDPPIPTDRFNRLSDYLPNARGNNIAIWRFVFLALGGWNENYRFAEDVEFSWRALNAGYRLTFTSDAAVQYRRRHSISGLAKQQYFRGRQTHRLQLVEDFGASGFSPDADAVRARHLIAWVIQNIPAGAFDRATRGNVIGTLAYGLGWAVGTPQRRRLHSRIHAAGP